MEHFDFRNPQGWDGAIPQTTVNLAKEWVLAQGYTLGEVPVSPEAFGWALSLGQHPWDNTQNLQGPEYRQVAIEKGFGFQYALFVDKAPHPDTLKAAKKEGLGLLYDNLFLRAALAKQEEPGLGDHHDQ